MLHELKTRPVFPHSVPVPSTEPGTNPALRCVCMNEIHTWALLWAGSYARCCDYGEETEVLVGRQTSKQAMMVQDEK